MILWKTLTLNFKKWGIWLKTWKNLEELPNQMNSIEKLTKHVPPQIPQFRWKVKRRLPLEQRIFQLERQIATAKSDLFEEKDDDDEKSQDTENLHGEFEKDIKKFDGQPKLQNLLRKYKEVFGPLPKPESGCKLVEMDIELKDEHKGKTLRQKYWPMPQEDAEEIEKQVQELVNAGLVEAFPLGTFPKHCFTTFLVDKKESKPGEWLENT